jgi:hypothetical protein
VDQELKGSVSGPLAIPPPGSSSRWLLGGGDDRARIGDLVIGCQLCVLDVMPTGCGL